MKINVFFSLISVALACLIGYLAFNVVKGEANDVMCGICSFVCFAATLIPTMGLQYESSRLGVNIRVFSAIFFVVFLISHFCFAEFGIQLPFYIILNGIILLIYLAVLYKMMSSKSV